MAQRKSMVRKAVRVDITLYGEDFMEIIEKYGDEAMFAAGEVVLREATSRAPRGRTGNLAKSGYVATGSKSTYRRTRRYWRKEKPAPKGGAVVAFTAPHAHLLESGRRKTGKIFPRGDVFYEGVLRRRGKKALRINGKFARHSRYKRMSSRPFVRPAVEASKESVPRELARVYETWLEKLLGGRP